METDLYYAFLHSLQVSRLTVSNYGYFALFPVSLGYEPRVLPTFHAVIINAYTSAFANVDAIPG